LPFAQLAELMQAGLGGGARGKVERPRLCHHGGARLPSLARRRLQVSGNKVYMDDLN
jgi:hypothetical protein